MATAMSRRNAKKVKALTSKALAELIKALQVSVPEATSLLDCAQKEQKRRHLQKVAKASLKEKMEISHGDQQLGLDQSASD